MYIWLETTETMNKMKFSQVTSFLIGLRIRWGVKMWCTVRLWQRFLAISNWRYCIVCRCQLGRSLGVSSGSGVVMSLDADISDTQVRLSVALVHLNHHVTLCFLFCKRVYAMYIDLVKKWTGLGRDVSWSPSSFFTVVMDEYRLTIFEFLDVWSNMFRYLILFLVNIISSVCFNKVDLWTYRRGFICSCIRYCAILKKENTSFLVKSCRFVVFSTHDFSFNRLNKSVGLAVSARVLRCGCYVFYSIQCHELLKFCWHELWVVIGNYFIWYVLTGR